MKPNIFYIDPTLGPEDTLTAYWHYLLSVVPGLGQKFVDAVCESSGLASSVFIGAIDHPIGNSQNRPDLLVQCRDWSLLFEHKLDSPVGPRQLHRYVDLATARGWKFALLAAGRVEIDHELLSSAAFVSPRDTERPSHFLWQDLHPILASANHHLASEFSEFLELNKLGRFSWSGLGDPFIDDGATKALLTLYDSLRAIFNGPGVQCRKSASSAIYQIRTPFHPVHLINVGPLQSVAQENPTLRGPVMGVWVWVRRGGTSTGRVLSMNGGAIEHGSLPILVKNHEGTVGLPYDRTVHAERSYYVPLEYILRDSLEASESALLEFVRAAVTHLTQELSGTVLSNGLQPTARVMKPPRLKPRR